MKTTGEITKNKEAQSNVKTTIRKTSYRFYLTPDSKNAIAVKKQI